MSYQHKRRIGHIYRRRRRIGHIYSLGVRVGGKSESEDKG